MQLSAYPKQKGNHMSTNFDGAGQAPKAPISHGVQVAMPALHDGSEKYKEGAHTPNYNFDGANDNPDAKWLNNKLPLPTNPMIADAKHSQPWQSDEAKSKAAPFLRKGEDVRSLIANAGITLHEILTLSHGELSTRINAGRERIRREKLESPNLALRRDK
jgi:hypothetical protein